MDHRPSASAIGQEQQALTQPSPELVADVESAFKPKKEAKANTPLFEPAHNSLVRMPFGDLSPKAQQIVRFQKVALHESGLSVSGQREIVTAGRGSVVQVFIDDDVTGKVGGQLHTNEAGKVQTIITTTFMGTGVNTTIPQKK